ncbi:MAG: hypothetical protein ACRYFS_11605 [Janthinobacterium lividum]
MLGTLFFPLAAHAGTYVWQGTDANGNPIKSPTISGTGAEAITSPSFTGNRPYISAIAYLGYMYGGYNLPSSSGSASDTLSGTIVTTYTWQPDPKLPSDPAPTSVIVAQSCGINCAITGTGSGTITNGLGASASGPALSGCSSVQYVVRGGTTFSVSCSPTMSATASASGVNGKIYVHIAYNATVYPVTLSLGGTTPDANGGLNILIGQHCSSSLNGIPSALLNNTANPPTYAWSVSGSTFQTWSADTPSFPVIVGGVQIGIIPENPDATYEVDGPIPSTNPTGWYWNDLAKGTGNSTQETVSCTATVTPPAGQGSAFTVSATQPVTVWTPVWTATGNGSAISVDNKYQPPDFWLHAGYAITGLGAFSGMAWKANLAAPPAPVLFGVGSLALVQIITSNDCGFMTNTALSVPLPYSSNGQTGLDLSWPYPWGTSLPTSVGGMYYTAGDSPGVPLILARSAHDNVSFEDHLMYCPPGSLQYVSVAKYIWSVNMSATLPATGNWINFTGSAGTITDSQNAGTFLPNNTFPAWTQIVQ